MGRRANRNPADPRPFEEEWAETVSAAERMSRFAQAYGSRARTMGEAVRGPNLQNIRPNENAEASYPRLAEQVREALERGTNADQRAQMHGTPQSPNSYEIANAQDGAVLSVDGQRVEQGDVVVVRGDPAPERGNVVTGNQSVAFGCRNTVSAPSPAFGYREVPAENNSRVAEQSAIPGIAERKIGVFKMNENFFLTGERNIHPGTLIRSWAILNTGEAPVVVSCYSNNSPRVFSTVVEPGEQFIDANCSLERLLLRSEKSTHVEIFYAPNTTAHWRFKSIEKQKPALPSIDEDYNPVYHQQIAPVVPVLETEEEKKDAPANPAKPAAGRSVLGRFFTSGP